MIPVVMYCCNTKQIDISHTYFTKYTFPINFFLLCQGIVLISSSAARYKWPVLVFVFLMLLSGINSTIIAFRPRFIARVHLTEALSDMCNREDPQQSKWYVCQDSLKSIGPCGLPDESITYSAYDHRPLAIQVVIDDRSFLDTLAKDKFFIAKGQACDTKELNLYYFHFRNGPYKELVLDPARLDIIRKACQP